MAPNYYEMMPNKNLFLVPVKRSLTEVIEERTKLVSYISLRTGCKIEVLAGVCDITKAGLMFNNGLSMSMADSIPIHLRLQDQIDVWNEITAEQVIAANYKEIEKEMMKMAL
jgi:hypothetical protein